MCYCISCIQYHAHICNFSRNSAISYLQVQGGPKKTVPKQRFIFFFVMRYLKLSFAHIALQDVQFMIFKGYFARTKGKNVIVC